jgi:hypothetical protein
MHRGLPAACDAGLATQKIVSTERPAVSGAKAMTPDSVTKPMTAMSVIVVPAERLDQHWKNRCPHDAA